MTSVLFRVFSQRWEKTILTGSGERRRSALSNCNCFDIVIDPISRKETDYLGEAVGGDKQCRLRDISDPLVPNEPRIGVFLAVPLVRSAEDVVLSPADRRLVAAIDIPSDDERGSAKPRFALADESHHGLPCHRFLTILGELTLTSVSSWGVTETTPTHSSWRGWKDSSHLPPHGLSGARGFATLPGPWGSPVSHGGWGPASSVLNAAA